MLTARIRRRILFAAAAFVLLCLSGCDSLIRNGSPFHTVFTAGSDRLDIENTALVRTNDAYFARRSLGHWGIQLP